MKGRVDLLVLTEHGVRNRIVFGKETRALYPEIVQKRDHFRVGWWLITALFRLFFQAEVSIYQLLMFLPCLIGP